MEEGIRWFHSCCLPIRKGKGEGKKFFSHRAFPEDAVKCFNTFQCLSKDGENDTEFSLPGFSSRVPVLKTPFSEPEWQDPEFLRKVRGLEGMLRVRKRLDGQGGSDGEHLSGLSSVPGTASRYSGKDVSGGSMSASSLVPLRGSAGENDSGGKVSARRRVGDGVIAIARSVPGCGVAGSSGEKDSGGKVSEIENDSGGKVSESENVSGGTVLARRGGCARVHADARRADTAHASAGESARIISLLDFSESAFPPLPNSSHAHNSCHRLSASACARASWSAAACAGVADCVCPVSSSSAESAVVHAHASSLHNAQNSWSDTGRVICPTGRRCTKGGVSGPAEDLRPVSEVEAGVNFRPAGRVRGQVAGSLPRRQPGTGTRRLREGVVTPSLHPEVPGIQFVSPGRGLDIRQSMGWTKVCETARSGIWVLKGNARTRMLPENLDHLPVRWISRGTYETAWVTPGHDCLCSYQYGHGAAVRPQTNDAIWHGVIGLWGRVAPLLSPWCGRRELPTGVNLNRYSGPSSCIRWHSDNEPLFGPQNSPKLIVSMSLGNSVEFKVRRGRCGIPSPITLDHGDLLVMDGRTQSEYVHCTASGLQGPRVNLTFRWVAQHIASCPLAGVMGCVLPSCVQGLAEPGSRGDGGEGNKWSFFWGLVLLLLIMVSFLLVGTLISIRRGHRHSDQRPSCSVVHLPSRGRARWVGGRRWSLSRRRQTPKGSPFYFPSILFWGKRFYSFFKSLGFFLPLGMLVATWVPPHATMMHIRWVPLIGHLGGKAGRSTVGPRFPPLLDVSFW